MQLSLSKNNSSRYLQYYYLATPLFIVLDWLFGVNIRVVIPGGPDTLYYLYYAFCFLAAFLTLASDALAALVALLECSVNILLLMLSVMWPLFSLGERISAGENVEFVFGPVELVHFAIAGTMLLLSFYGNPLIKRAELP